MGWFAIVFAALCSSGVRASTILPGFIAAVPETLEPPKADDLGFKKSGTELYVSPKHNSWRIYSKGEGYLDRSYNPAQILRSDRPWEEDQNFCIVGREYEGEVTGDWCWNYLTREDNDDWVFTKIVGTNKDDKIIGSSNSNGNYSGWKFGEIIVAGKGDDIVIGDHGDDHIFGGAGEDVLHGDDGDDVIVGNEAGDDSPDMDIIFSGSGSDTVYAQGGDDWIYTDEIANNNLDWLSGGTGADTFVISQPFGDMGTPGWTLDAMDLILGFSNDVFDLYFAGFLPKWKITKEIAPMSLDIVKWIIDGVPDETVDPPHKGRCIIADFNPLQDRILVQLDPHRMSPNVSIQPANNGENAWILTSDGFDLCYVNRAPAEDIFGDDVNYIGSTPSDILIKMLQQNAKVVGGGKFALGIEQDPNWYDHLVEPPEALADTDNGRFLMIGNWAGYVTIGSAGHDHLIGNDHPNGDALYGYALDIEGGDVIAVKDGDDILRGYGGDDLLAGGTGFNQIYGGDGDDTVSFAHARTGVVVDMERTGQWHEETFFAAWNGFNIVDEYDPDEDISLTGKDGYDWVFGVEGVIGGPYDDEIFGNDLPNTIFGGAGYNTVRGRGGSDTFVMTDGGTAVVLDFDIDEGDILLIDRESSNMNLMHKNYHITDLVYYHQDGDLYIEIKSSGETVAILSGVTMSNSIWESVQIKNDRDTTRTCIEAKDGSTGFCTYDNSGYGLHCKAQWNCEGAWKCIAGVNRCYESCLFRKCNRESDCCTGQWCMSGSCITAEH
eukprot:Clim_evm4s38 gene=Clim_evmTU4s38